MPNGEIGQACAAEIHSLTHATLEQSHFKKWAHTSGELGDVNTPVAQSTKLTPDSMHQHEYAETRDRTGDLQIFSLTLSQLSYRGSWRCGNRETDDGDAQLRCIFRIWLGA